MQNIIAGITDFFTGKSKAPANPDLAHNIILLNETRKKIKTGIFTRFFKRPTIYILEIVTYVVTSILFIAGFLIWNKIDNYFDVYATSQFLIEALSKSDLGHTDISWVSNIILFILLLPSVICFLLARLFTKSRKRMNVFIQVENMIDRVVFNLKNE